MREIIGGILIFLAALALGGCQDAKLTEMLIKGCFENGGAPVVTVEGNYTSCVFPTVPAKCEDRKKGT